MQKKKKREVQYSDVNVLKDQNIQLQQLQRKYENGINIDKHNRSFKTPRDNLLILSTINLQSTVLLNLSVVDINFCSFRRCDFIQSITYIETYHF